MDADMPDRTHSPHVTQVIERNVESLLKDRQRADAARTFQQHLADWITRFAGSMTFVYLHVGWFAIWIAANLGVVKFDPSFAGLTMIVSLEAIFLSVFVLVSQNRQSEMADRRAELDLQINLLDEHETTRILTLVTALAQKAGIDCADTELEELKNDVEPEHVLEHIENSQKKAAK